LFLVLFVDDLVITGISQAYIDAMKGALHDRFLMSDLGLLHFFLRIEITKSDSRITMTQSKYGLNLLSCC